MNIPTLPDLAAGEVVAAADLNNIASACTFLLGKPIARIHDITGGLSIVGSASVVTYTTKDFDTDGMWSSGAASRLTVQTPGWYKVRYSVQIAGGIASSTAYSPNVLVQTGANNPQGSGVQFTCLQGGGSEGGSGLTTFAGASGIIPAYMYPGDFVRVQISASATGTHTGADAGMPYSFFSMEFASA